MILIKREILFVVIILAVVSIFVPYAGSQTLTPPYIGYLYPAGGQQGSTIRILAAGQYLKGVDSVYVSGEGISAKVVEYMRPLNREQQRELGRRLADIRQKRLFPNRPLKVQPEDTTEPKVVIPEYSMLQNLENKTDKELQKIAVEFLTANNRLQPPKESTQEKVIIEINISPNASAGNRDIRLGANGGLTNPMCFQVGPLPEIKKDDVFEPNVSINSTPLNIPVVVNGQLRVGEVDRYRFNAKRGEKLVIVTQARSLIPYLADAVPGWFQPSLTLYDSSSNEVAFGDHYRFDPDPVVFYEVPNDDEYQLEIRDSIYRGREDFIYRVSIGTLPFVTGMFPLGGREGSRTFSWLTGWNLPSKLLVLDTHPGSDYIRETTLKMNHGVTNQIKYAVETLPETTESETNDEMRSAQRITLPLVINGRINHPGDSDMFSFDGHKGENIVVEVYARRLGSPLDSLVRILNSKGKIIGWNDDAEDKESGLLTHHADSYLITKLPDNGKYYVQIIDTQNHGGDEYAYRLRVSYPQPDYALRIVPSSINIPAGRTLVFDVYAMRKDGFNGDIEVVIEDTTNSGFTLSGGKIPSGQDHIRMTLTAPFKTFDEPVIIKMAGLSRINEIMINRPVIPADDMMQAFAYRHLVPAHDLMISVANNKNRPAFIEPAIKGTIVIPADKSVQVTYRTPPRMSLANIRLQLNDPPKGISLKNVVSEPGTLRFQLVVDGKMIKAGYKNNLIVELINETEQKDTKNNKKKIRNSIGILPAIPIEVVKW